MSGSCRSCRSPCPWSTFPCPPTSSWTPTWTTRQEFTVLYSTSITVSWQRLRWYFLFKATVPRDSRLFFIYRPRLGTGNILKIIIFSYTSNLLMQKNYPAVWCIMKSYSAGSGIQVHYTTKLNYQGFTLKIYLSIYLWSSFTAFEWRQEEEGEDDDGSSRSQDSMYEMGPEMDSLTHSLEHLDSQVRVTFFPFPSKYCILFTMYCTGHDVDFQALASMLKKSSGKVRPITCMLCRTTTPVVWKYPDSSVLWSAASTLQMEFRTFPRLNNILSWLESLD